MPAVAPSLVRAIAQCTQPFGGPVVSPGTQLQMYFIDEKSTNEVYRLLVQRAWTEPLSAAVVEKVLAIFKHFLIKFTPSPDVLGLLLDFCDQIPHSVKLLPSGTKALQYIRACVKKLGKLDAVTSNAPKRSLSAMRDEPPVAATAHRSSADFVAKSTPHPLAGSLDSPHLPLPPTASPPPNVLPSHVLLSDDDTPIITNADDALESHSYDPPSWAVLGAWEIAKAAAVAAGKNLTPPADADLSWVLQVPDLIPHLSVPAVLGALDIENGPLTMGKARHSESTGKNPPVDASAIVKCVLDVDEADIPRHLREVSDALRAEVEQNSLSTHVVATKRSNNRLQPHARMLFHHPPYNMQEEVNLCEADVTIVVEVVCGIKAASSLTRQASQAGAAADSPSWQTRYDSDGLGQMCGAILVKLVMDLFLTAGPGNSFPLLMRMLGKALANADPKVRARAYDVVYNLGVHSALLREDGSSEEEDTKEEETPRPVHVLFKRWLRTILFQLLQLSSQVNEPDELVWCSALGTLLQLTTHGGHFVSSWVEHIPMQAIAGLLRAAANFNWSQELYCNLIKISSQLLAATEEHGPCNEGSAVPGGTLQRGSSRFPVPMGIPESFGGGLSEVLYHLARAPTAASRNNLVAVLLMRLTPDALAAVRLTCTLTALHVDLFSSAIQTGLRCPRPGMDKRLAEAATLSLDTIHEASLPLASPMRDSLTRGPSSMTRGTTSGPAAAAAAAAAAAMAAVSAVHASPEELQTFMSQLQSDSRTSEEFAEMEGPIQVTLLHMRSTTTKDVSSSPGGSSVVGHTLPGREALSRAWQAFRDLCTNATEGSPKRQLAVSWLNKILHQAFLSSQSNLLMLTPLNLSGPDAGKVTTSTHVPAGSTYAWSEMLSEALLHVVRHSPNGNDLLWQAAGRAVCDLKQIAPNTTPSAESYSTTTRTVMGALHITLMWMLQSVDISEAGGLSSIHALADHVLTAMCSASHKEDCNTEHGPNGTQPSPPVWVDQHVATALIDGNVTLDPVVLHNTPPELLVLLLRQCAPANSSSSTQPLSPHDSGGGDVNGAGAGPQQGCGPNNMLRGFSGRPSEAVRARWGAHGESVAAGECERVQEKASFIPSADGPGSVWSRCEMWCEQSSDRRLSLLVAIMARCALDPDAFAKYGLAPIMKGQLLASEDVRERYLGGVYLLNHWMLNQQDKYWRTLRQLVSQAQQVDDERLIQNPYLQICTMLSVDHA